MNSQDFKDMKDSIERSKSMKAAIQTNKGVLVGSHDVTARMLGTWAGRITTDTGAPTHGQLENLLEMLDNCSRIYECKFVLTASDMTHERFYVVRDAPDGQRVTGSVFAGSHTVRELQCLLYAFCKAAEFARWIDCTNQERIDGGFDPAPPPTTVKYCLPGDPGYFIPPTVAGYCD